MSGIIAPSKQRISMSVDKGWWKEVKEMADSLHISATTYMVLAVTEKMRKDKEA